MYQGHGWRRVGGDLVSGLEVARRVVRLGSEGVPGVQKADRVREFFLSEGLFCKV